MDAETTIAGQTYTMNTAYDSFSRVSQTTYLALEIRGQSKNVKR